MNPDNPEDALKSNADPQTGAGGDDDFDCCRYGLNSRPIRADSPWKDEPFDAFSREGLRAEHDQGRRVKRSRPPEQGGVEFGVS
jgi:hypothetical protein